MSRIVKIRKDGLDFIVILATQVDLMEVIEVFHGHLVAHVRIRFLLHQFAVAVGLGRCFWLPVHQRHLVEVSVVLLLGAVTLAVDLEKLFVVVIK